MNIEIIFFIILAAIAVFSSVMMITRRNPVMSAIFLILNFFALAGLYLLLNAQFIAVVQIIVYAGAIMVLFLFVIMLLNPGKEEHILATRKGIKLFAVFISAVVFVQLTYLIFKQNPSTVVMMNPESSVGSGTVERIGREIYTNYIIPFEAAGFLLLAATIGAMLLARKKTE